MKLTSSPGFPGSPSGPRRPRSPWKTTTITTLSSRWLCQSKSLTVWDLLPFVQGLQLLLGFPDPQLDPTENQNDCENVTWSWNKGYRNEGEVTYLCSRGARESSWSWFTLKKETTIHSTDFPCLCDHICVISVTLDPDTMAEMPAFSFNPEVIWDTSVPWKKPPESFGWSDRYSENKMVGDV